MLSVMQIRCCLATSFVLLVLAAAPGGGQAAGRVELEVFTEDRLPVTARHDWLRELSRAGIANLRIRAKQSGDEVSIKSRGTQTMPVYTVTAALGSDNELVVPGARFRLSEATRLARWLDELAEHGPPAEREPTTAFGLTVSQFEQVRRELAQPVGFSTKEASRREVVERIARRLRVPLKIGPGERDRFATGNVSAELSGLSCGTALAYALRAPGLCLVPRPAGGGVELVVVRSQPDLDIWPIGWEPEQRLPDLVPEMYEFLNVNVQNVSVATVIAAVGQRTKLPILMDRNALARHGLDPEKATAHLPKSRTTYSLVLRKVLFQGGLKYEVRVDEAEKPFLWITSIKPLD